MMVVSAIPIDTFQWLSLSVIIVLVLVKFVQRVLFANKFAHIQGPKAYPILGNVLDIAGLSTHEFFKFVSEQCAKHRGCFVMWVGSNPKVYFQTPDCTQAILSSTELIDKSTEYGLLSDWLGTGLLTGSGKKWHHRRKILTPAFHYNILETMTKPMQKVTDILVARLEKQVDQAEFNIFPYMKLVSLDSICETTMGYDLGAQLNQNSGYCRAIEEVAELSMRRFMMPWLHYDLVFRNTAMGRTYYSNLTIIQDFTLKVIKERRQQLLEELLSDQHKDNTSHENTELNTKKKRTTCFLDLCLQLQELTDADIREEVNTFMFAGHDTTAGVASWTLYALGHHPDIQARIVAEAEEVGFYGEGPPSTQTLASMDYLERCIKESLRLYPPVPVFARQIYEPLRTPSIDIPAGCSIFIHVFEQHRNPDYFPNPLQFHPDRFLEKIKHPYAYIPFSAGPRNCIGQKVAMISQKIFIASILKKFVIESVVKPEDLKLAQNIVLENEDGLKIRLKRR